MDYICSNPFTSYLRVFISECGNLQSQGFYFGEKGNECVFLCVDGMCACVLESVQKNSMKAPQAVQSHGASLALSTQTRLYTITADTKEHNTHSGNWRVFLLLCHLFFKSLFPCSFALSQVLSLVPPSTYTLSCSHFVSQVRISGL